MSCPTLAAHEIEVFARARRARDPRFDGLFFIAVRSTGIYCRPICPAPSAKESNVRYFLHAASAAAAGFRPCLRCRPELAPGLAPCERGERRFELAWQRIREGALSEGRVADLAAEVGLSDRQLRRQFLQRAGVTPLDVALTQRLLLAKQLLTETALPITEIAYASGFRSLRRFNDAFLRGCGMPPSRLRQRRAAEPSVSAVRIRLAYRPPYDLDGMFGFLAARAVSGIERVQGHCYQRIVGAAGRVGRITLTPLPGADALQLAIEGDVLLQLPDLLRRLRRLFDLDAQPQAVSDLLAADPRLQASLQAAPGLRVPGAFDGFETAIRAVLGQQVSVAAARTLCTRLVERWGEAVQLGDGESGRLFPTPQRLAEAEVGQIGLPAARAATIRALSRAVADGAIDLERSQPVEDWLQRLQALPGIGPWTAQYMAMRCLHHPDAFPAGDLVVRKQLGAATALNTVACEAIAEAWRPWRAYAVLHLWRAASTPIKEH